MLKVQPLPITIINETFNACGKQSFSTAFMYEPNHAIYIIKALNIFLTFPMTHLKINNKP